MDDWQDWNREIYIEVLPFFIFLSETICCAEHMQLYVFSSQKRFESFINLGASSLFSWLLVKQLSVALNSILFLVNFFFFFSYLTSVRGYLERNWCLYLVEVNKTKKKLAISSFQEIIFSWSVYGTWLSFIVYHRNGEMEKDYDGDRSAEDIINFMKR